MPCRSASRGLPPSRCCWPCWLTAWGPRDQGQGMTLLTGATDRGSSEVPACGAPGHRSQGHGLPEAQEPSSTRFATSIHLSCSARSGLQARTAAPARRTRRAHRTASACKPMRALQVRVTGQQRASFLRERRAPTGAWDALNICECGTSSASLPPSGARRGCDLVSALWTEAHPCKALTS